MVADGIQLSRAQVACGLQHEKNQLYASVDENSGIVFDVASNQ